MDEAAESDDGRDSLQRREENTLAGNPPHGDLIEDYEALAQIGQEKQVELLLAIKDPASFQEATRVFKKYSRSLTSPSAGSIRSRWQSSRPSRKGSSKKGDKWVCLSGMPQIKALDNLLILDFGNRVRDWSSPPISR